MKYILFLLSILFFNLSLLAQDGTSTDSIRVNLGNYQSDFMKPKSDFTRTMDDMNNFSVGTEADPFSLNTPTVYSYGTASGGIRFGQPTCSIRTPQACLLYSSCRSAGGFWNAIDSTCVPSSCHMGTTPEVFNPTRCRCNAPDSYAYVDRGNFLQSCPSQCLGSENKMYSFISRSCTCLEGYTMAANGSCNANPAPAQSSAPDCWRELAEKAKACETAANTAVAQCDSGEDDTMSAMRNLLVSTSGSASENCERAATAGTSGYHHVDDTRRACDEKINSCKTGCGDATTFLNANKERAYNACRERAYQEQVNAGPPLPPDRFNPMWDSENKANLDSQFQSLLTKIDSSRATCETGTAAKNREKLTTAMNEMNTTSRSANQCVCQLGSTSADCSKSVKGPADCLEDPTLPGCAKVADNCFDANNVSLKCICFRNPESAQCKGALPVNVKVSEMDTSSFAGAKGSKDTRGNNSEVSGMAAGKTTEGIGNVGGVGNAGENSGIYAEAELAIPTAASESASAGGNTGGEKPAAGAGTGFSGGNTSKGTNSSAAVLKNDGGVVNKLSGFFDTAKSALGGIFKKGSNTGETSDYHDGSNSENQGFESGKFRPRGMVRGIASDNGIAGKHEDIWKVMNKQYKVQDQKDNFIFDTEKK